MNRKTLIRLVFTSVGLAFFAMGCSRTDPVPAEKDTAKLPTVATLVPSATDLLLGMGAGDHLVAVSNYDRASALPRVGDYVAIDWEKLAQLRPNVLITFYGTDRAPAGLVERTRDLGIKVLNLRFDRLSDLYVALRALGKACGEPAKSQIEMKRIQDGIARVRQRISGEPRIRAAIVTESSGMDFAGRDNYLDDLLNEAGGENAIVSPGYVTLDREAIAAMKPQVILQLLPASDEATRNKVEAFWKSFPELPAVRGNRVFIFTESYMMTPGSHVVDVAGKFAAALHPRKEPASQSSTTNVTR